ncbi:hypothetical protein HZZ00_06805 [Streptomyces sp. NEAU-sy36]|uniref:hypothetical protein n=1 Tax=unclassified Streptomyces TaxID=2593676 RepID=UPI0015D5F71C|nr:MULTISPECIES: hypothetical protein [unclassified Streptomyces]QLJ00726.1 hypothetical protein HZZ00_06805 [Streptomyces sp. NEAU-sy36]
MRYEDAYRDWLRRLHEELNYPDPDDPPPWTREVFEANGELPAERFAWLAFDRRLRDIGEAFTRVSATARAHTGIDVPAHLHVEEPCEQFPVGGVSFDGSAIWSAEPPEVHVDVAEAVQTYLADRHRTVWPLCATHRTGTHPRVSDGRPVWWCHPGGHAPAPIT